jgi:hypothetical protein
LSEIRLPDDPSDWQRGIKDMARSYRELALSHPNAVPLMATRPFNTLASLGPVEVAFGMFKRAGFEGADAVHAFRTLTSFAIGYTLAETQGVFNQDSSGEALSMTDIPLEQFPNLIEFAPYFESSDPNRGFDFAFEVMLTGLEAKLKEKETS